MFTYLISSLFVSWKVLRAQAKDSNFVGKETTENQVQPQYCFSMQRKLCLFVQGQQILKFSWWILSFTCLI